MFKEIYNYFKDFSIIINKYNKIKNKRNQYVIKNTIIQITNNKNNIFMSMLLLKKYFISLGYLISVFSSPKKYLFMLWGLNHFSKLKTWVNINKNINYLYIKLVYPLILLLFFKTNKNIIINFNTIIINYYYTKLFNLKKKRRIKRRITKLIK